MIYCVEDDDNIRELVIYTLETTGLRPEVSQTVLLLWKLWRLIRRSLFCLTSCFPATTAWNC